jgi:tagatose 1,6-diphosphate aldolase
VEFLSAAPGGLVMGDEHRGIVPGYYFWMRWRDPATQRYRIAGGISVRVGYTQDIEQYSGHIGYHVYPTARGKHFAERACRLVCPLLQHYQIRPTWITVNPDNLPSRRTCERLGAVYVNTVAVPTTHPFYQRGETQKCRYRWEI